MMLYFVAPPLFSRLPTLCIVETREGTKDPAAHPQEHRRAAIVLLATIALVLVARALKATSILAAPLAFAFFVAVLVHPRSQGWTLQISPLIILVSLIFWSWLWGVAGALLAVAMTALFSSSCITFPR